MRRILLSAGMIVFVGALVAGSTGAFFTDEETSSGNTLAAGAIDLGIDNTSYYNGVANATTTWDLSYDLDDGQGPSTGGTYRFFDFYDLKPGDYGEDTISIHVTDNDAWMCVDILFDVNDDVDCTEPENDADAENGGCNEPNLDLNDGDLAQEINFLFWADDGDNVLEEGEQIVGNGPINGLAFNSYTTFALADSDENNLGGTPGEPITGAETHYLGKAWCFGAISEAAVPQDGFGDQITPAGDNENGDGTGNGTAGEPSDGGFDCDGAQSISNASQTDRVEGDITFRAVQSRNNGDYQCEAPDAPTATLTLVKEVINDQGVAVDTDWTLTASTTDTILSGVEGDGAITGASVTPGSMDLSESGPAGYTLTDLSCDGGTLVDNTLTLTNGDNVTCTFTNTEDTLLVS